MNSKLLIETVNKCPLLFVPNYDLMPNAFFFFAFFLFHFHLSLNLPFLVLFSFDSNMIHRPNQVKQITEIYGLVRW